MMLISPFDGAFLWLHGHYHHTDSTIMEIMPTESVDNMSMS